MTPQHLKPAMNPIADQEAIVCAPNVRFTVLTSQLIRMEYNPNDQFEDCASQAFWYRQQPVPKFNVARTYETITITTADLQLKYTINPSGFTRKTLTVHVNTTNTTWHYGDRSRRDNLYGTARTLDTIDGAQRLEQGLMSRAGWSVVDDSNSLVFNADSWLENRSNDEIDLYFFGYGHDYKKCLRDFCAIAGHTPMIPRWILGNWWSRYWEYTQAELTDLMHEFKEHDVPLSICIVDMDWHITETGNDCTGWTGYTWNRKLFPDPAGFIAWLHEQGLKTALNLHPAEGIHAHEEQYVEIAKALGFDSTTREPIDFDIADPKFAQAYFEILHHPYEKMGVDFWWLDWQQGTLSKLPRLDPLWWLNHLHFYDHGRDGKKRPFIFSRWGGLGNHRYPIGFSGDAIATWKSLAFQPHFTATAANVGYGWWSHDIGGHMGGVTDAELYARWVQFGVFSPILRLHSTKNPYQERLPWGYDAETFRIVRDAMQLRHTLIPYIYTMAWRNRTHDLPIITPMYYDYPEDENAYRCPNQYFFGSELIATPFVSPLDEDTRLAQQSVWLPAGDWFNFFDGEYFAGDQWHIVHGTRDEIPVFAKAGAIVPLAPRVNWGGVENPAELIVHAFPGADNRFALYEDDGATTAYEKGHYRLTTFAQTYREREWQFAILPTQGDAAITPTTRDYQLVFHGIRQPARVQIEINGAAIEARQTYDEQPEALTIEKMTLGIADTLIVTLFADDRDLPSRRDRRIEKFRRMLHTFKMSIDLKATLDRDLGEILADPRCLRRYSPELKDAQIAALLNVLQK